MGHVICKYPHWTPTLSCVREANVHAVGARRASAGLFNRTAHVIAVWITFPDNTLDGTLGAQSEIQFPVVEQLKLGIQFSPQPRPLDQSEQYSGDPYVL